MDCSAGPSWEESEKENYCKSRKAELETLVTFLSKFDSKVAAIWDEGINPVKGRVWEDESGQGRGEPELGQGLPQALSFQSTMTDELIGNSLSTTEGDTGTGSEVPEEEDLLISPRTHFKPIRDYRDELPPLPPLAFLPFQQKDPADYAVYNRTATSSFPLLFLLKSPDNDKAVQTDEEELSYSSMVPPSFMISPSSGDCSSLGTSSFSSGSIDDAAAAAFHLSITTASSSSVSSPSLSSDSSPFYFTAGTSVGYNFPPATAAYSSNHRQ